MECIYALWFELTVAGVPQEGEQKKKLPQSQQSKVRIPFLIALWPKFPHLWNGSTPPSNNLLVL